MIRVVRVVEAALRLGGASRLSGRVYGYGCRLGRPEAVAR